jgi:hypothetical protein
VKKRVLRCGEIPFYIAHKHEKEQLQDGARSLHHQMNEEFHAIPRIVCDAWVARCLVCAQKAAKKSNKYPIIAIKSSGFNNRVQVSHNQTACCLHALL